MFRVKKFLYQNILYAAVLLFVHIFTLFRFSVCFYWTFLSKTIIKAGGERYQFVTLDESTKKKTTCKQAKINIFASWHQTTKNFQQLQKHNKFDFFFWSFHFVLAQTKSFSKNLINYVLCIECILDVCGQAKIKTLPTSNWQLTVTDKLNGHVNNQTMGKDKTFSQK